MIAYALDVDTRWKNYIPKLDLQKCIYDSKRCAGESFTTYCDFIYLLHFFLPFVFYSLRPTHIECWCKWCKIEQRWAAPPSPAPSSQAKPSFQLPTRSSSMEVVRQTLIALKTTETVDFSVTVNLVDLVLFEIPSNTARGVYTPSCEYVEWIKSV